MHIAITDSMLAIMLAVAFLAAALLAIVCYRPFAARGDPLDAFLVVAALILVGASGGFGTAYLARGDAAGLGSYLPAFLISICSALIFAAILALRRRGGDKGEEEKGGPR